MPYRQIADVAIKKARQYREGEINILLIDSDSETATIYRASRRTRPFTHRTESCS
jgi:hypothetical protein